MQHRVLLHLMGLVLVALAGNSSPLSAQPATRPVPPRDSSPRPTRGRLHRAFIAKSLTLPDGDVHKYAVFVPPAYEREPEQRWPVLLYLHGSGQIGDDGIKHTRRGLPRTISGRVDDFPMIVVMPQAHSMWFQGKNGQAALGALETTLSEYRCDPDRIYLTGVSMGGFATWDFAMTHPDLFAAIVPICGVGSKVYVSNIIDLPIWAFHSAEDPNVSVSGSREPIAELRRLGGKPRYTEYPGRKHNCWDRAYATPELWKWLLAQRRTQPPKQIDYLMPPSSQPVIARVWWFAFKTAGSATEPAHIRAEITDDNSITVLTRGIDGWIIESADEPLKPGTEIAVTWNHVPVMKGEFSGRIAVEYKPNATTAPSQQAQSAPADR